MHITLPRALKVQHFSKSKSDNLSLLNRGIQLKILTIKSKPLFIKNNTSFITIITCHFKRPFCFWKHNLKSLIYNRCKWNNHVPPRSVSAREQFSPAAWSHSLWFSHLHSSKPGEMCVIKGHFYFITSLKRPWPFSFTKKDVNKVRITPAVNWN